MTDVKFRIKNTGDCPRYKEYYITNKYVGKDIYSHDAYEYALFKDPKIETVRFDSFEKAEEWVKKEIGTIFSTWYSYDDKRIRAVIIKDVVYRIWKESNTVDIQQPPERLTPFYDNYRDCLEASKKIVADKEKQYSIFDYYVANPEKDNLPTKKRQMIRRRENTYDI